VSRDVAFVVLLSAPAGSIAEQDLYRIEQRMRADDMAADGIDKALTFLTTYGCRTSP